MSTAPKFPPITIQQYLGFKAPEGYRDELIEGEIVLSPDAKPLHHAAALNVFRSLDALLGPEFELGRRINFQIPDRNSMPSPDVWVIKDEIWQTALENDTYPDGGPIFAVEVISPSNTKRRVEQKVSLYLDGGTVEVWCIYPRRQEVPVHSTTGVATYANAPEVSIPLPPPLVGEILLSSVFEKKSRNSSTRTQTELE